MYRQASSVSSSQPIAPGATSILLIRRFEDINAFFNSWYNALIAALDTADSKIMQIIVEFDPEKQTHTVLNDILTVVGIAVFFIPVAGPEVSAALTAGAAVGDAILKGIKAAPGVAQALWPVGTANSQDTQTRDLSTIFSAPGGIRDGLLSNLLTALELVQGVNQTNVTTFLAFASNGTFTPQPGSRPTINVITGQDEIQTALLTYLASYALAQNGWHILMRPSVDPLGLTNGTTQCPSWAGQDCTNNHNLKCIGYDAYMQCNNSYWWYSSDQNAAYTLNHNDNSDSTNFTHDALSNTWATGYTLFELAAICEVQYAIDQYLSPSPPSTNYTTYNGKAGISYTGNIPTLQSSDVTTGPAGTTFLPFDGSGLSRLSADPNIAKNLAHPFNGNYETIWQNFGSQGFDFNCLSQLNVTIENQWESM